MGATDDFLKFWVQIYEEAGSLCERIELLPDQCECGDGDAHLEGRCRCCVSRGQASATQGSQETCTAIITRLRADLSIFCQDFSQIAGPLQIAASGAAGLELRRGVFLTAGDLQQIVKTVERVSDAVVGFRRTCDILELRSIKRHSVELRTHLNQLNAKLEAPKD